MSTETAVTLAISVTFVFLLIGTVYVALTSHQAYLKRGMAGMFEAVLGWTIMAILWVAFCMGIYGIYTSLGIW